MIYLNENHIDKLGFDWDDTVDVIERAVKCLDEKDFVQPVKPYLRFRDIKNRIIAMPAFLGGDFDVAGIKWIASFPKNIEKGIKRAHSVLILNNSQTGEPEIIINTALVSVIRTASVSGLILKYFRKNRDLSNIKVGIVGLGPIGKFHLAMVMDQLGNHIGKVFMYDKKGIDKSVFDKDVQDKLQVAASWEEAYEGADIFITCTVAEKAYINKKPKPGSLHLNVSLRDYTVEVYDYFKECIIVDNWEEICREGTDIENMHLHRQLVEKDTHSIMDVVAKGTLDKLKPETPVFFNPMGMAVFDVAIGDYFLKKVKATENLTLSLTV